jgi:hypothetical protein
MPPLNVVVDGAKVAPKDFNLEQAQSWITQVLDEQRTVQAQAYLPVDTAALDQVDMLGKKHGLDHLGSQTAALRKPRARL